MSESTSPFICRNCGSADIAYYARHPDYTKIPAGVYRFCACRACLYWWEAESVADTSIAGEHWKLTGHGQGRFTDEAGKDATRWPLKDLEES